MNLPSGPWYLLLGATVLLVAAFWTSDLATAAGCAAGAAGLAGLFLILTLVRRVHWPGFPTPSVDADPLVLLRNAFSEGRFGRETILARLDALDATLGGGGAGQRSEERLGLLGASEPEFLGYVERRVGEIEART